MYFFMKKFSAFFIPLIFCAAVSFAQKNPIDAHVLPDGKYPYWGEYKQTKFEDVRPAEWIVGDGVRDGWDWSLPPKVKPAPNSYSTFYRTGFKHMRQKISELKPLPFPSIPVIGFWLNWKDLEPVEGEYNFEPLVEAIKAAAEKGYYSTIRIHTASTRFAPQWLFDKYGVQFDPNPEKKGDGMQPIDPAQPEFHKRYIKLIDAFGASGIPQMEEVKGMYVGYSSYSNGDEEIGPKGKNPDEFPHVIERLDAWARAAKGVEGKVFMGEWSDYGVSKGFGIRRGFVEMYLYFIPAPQIGQYVDKDGYLCVDENSPIIKNNARNGEENEEYELYWTTPQGRYRWGKNTDSFNYRYFTSNLRMLQMRTNDVIWNEFTIDPEMFVWVGLELGKTVKKAPDAWCFLRESYLWPNYMKSASNPSTGLKNFERWVYQRDSEGFETEPAVKIIQPVKMWMVRDDKRFDYVARTGAKIGFKVDHNFLKGRNKKVAVKVSFFDFGKGKFRIDFNHDGAVESRTVECTDSGKVRTATFFVEADFIKNASLKHDFEIVGEDGYKPTVSILRVVKL